MQGGKLTSNLTRKPPARDFYGEPALRLHPAHRLRPRPLANTNTPTPLLSSLREPVQAPPTTNSTHPGLLTYSSPAHRRSRPRPLPRPRLRLAVAEGLFRVLGSPCCFRDERLLVRLRGVVGRLPLQPGLGTAERLVRSAAAAPGRAFQIVPALRRNGGAAAEGPRRAAGERNRGLASCSLDRVREPGELRGLHACRLHPRRRAKPGAGGGRLDPSHLPVFPGLQRR